MIEKEVQSIEYEVKPYPVLEYVDNYFKDRNIIDQDFYKKTSKYTCPKIPESIMSDKHYKFDFEDQAMWYKFSNRSDLILIDEISQNVLIDMSDLMQNYASNSESNKNAMKFSYIKFDREITEKLLRKCKEGKFKVNGVINMLMMIAVKDIYAQYGKELNEMNYMNSISLLQFFSKEDQKIMSTISYMATTMPISFKTDFTVDYMIDNFWSLAKEESNLLHNKLANNQQFKRFDWGNYTYCEEEAPYLFFSSNLGAYENKESCLIKIIDSIICQSDIRKPKLWCLTIAPVTIDNQLGLSFYWNNYSMNYLFVEMTKNVITKLMNIILD
jgi:hypothetical protein